MIDTYLFFIVFIW